MGGGSGSGGTTVMTRQPSQEKPAVGNWYGFQQGQFNDYFKNQPLLNQASQGAQSFWGGLPSMLGQFGGFQNQLSGLNQQTGAIGSQLGSWLGQVNPIIQSGGALTPQMERDVSQQTRNIASAQGTAASPGALGTELLNRDAYRQQRFNTALGQGQGLLGQQQGVYGQQAGLVGQQSGLLGQEQALQTGGLNQLLGVQNAATQNFSGLTNPILGYLGNLFSGNQQASVAQAQINAQQQNASNSKDAGLLGGGASLLGSVAIGL